MINEPHHGNQEMNPLANGSPLTRFTRDGSDPLETHLASICFRVRDGVRSIIPARELEGLLLAGGYGRGEGGVRRTQDGEVPYNDLEFYVFVRGDAFIQERRYHARLHALGEALSPDAGLEVEFKVMTRTKLRQGPVTMFSYDLVSRHHWVLGDDTLLEGCGHHLQADNIPLHEATRLMMNRCSGLLFSRERLARSPFEPADADFVGRNIAKAQLALGDIWLCARGQYHWSCLERHQRLHACRESEWPLPRDTMIRMHAVGVEFKLHPGTIGTHEAALGKAHAEVVGAMLSLWIWLENRRLGVAISDAEQYAFSSVNKCPETSWSRNLLIHALKLGPASLLRGKPWRYPRERLLQVLAWLLFTQDPLGNPKTEKWLSDQLGQRADSFAGWVRAYERLWHRFH